MDVRTNERMDGRTDGKSPRSTGLRPLSGLLPKKLGGGDGGKGRIEGGEEEGEKEVEKLGHR